jgi:hypothetical protein
MPIRRRAENYAMIVGGAMPNDVFWFNRDHFESELTNAQKVLAEFLDKDSQVRFDNFRHSFVGLKHLLGKTKTLEIKADEHIQTKLSDGSCEPGGGGRKLVGSMSGTWVLTMPAEKSKRDLVWCNNASWVVTIIDAQSQTAEVITRWTFDIGSCSSPGSRLHTQLFRDHAANNSLPIPRLFNLILTPTDVAAFMISELFQDEWRQRTLIDSSAAVDNWGGHQRRRNRNLLECIRTPLTQDRFPLSSYKQWVPENLELWR